MTASRQKVSPLKTLGLKRTKDKDQNGMNESVELNGVGSCKDSLRKRPKRKIVTQGLSRALAKVAKENNELNWEKRYWRAWHCQSRLLTYEGRGYGKFCGNRFCTVCCSIRKAHLINRYRPIIESWKSVRFLTLTAQSVKKNEIKKRIDEMTRWFSLLLDKNRKQHKRGKVIKLIGIKSLECNYNPIDETYNPHYHMLLDGFEVSKIINLDWLKHWRKLEKPVNPFAQLDKRLIKREKGLIEVMKYGAKIFTDPTMKKKKLKYKGKGQYEEIQEAVPEVVYAAALHEIYKAFDGKQLMTSFGFNLPKQDKKVSKRIIQEGVEEWLFDQKARTYVNTDTGQVWNCKQPDANLEYMLENIDKEKN